MTATTGSRWLMSLLLGLMLIMAVEIGYLIYQNKQLRAQLAEVSRQFEPLAAGSRAPAISGRDIVGSELAIRYGEGAPATMLFCFSASCDACEGNVPFWNSLYSELAPDRLRCVGLCAGMVDEARTYAKTNGITYPVLSIVDERLWAALHGEALPQTILIGPDGTVRNVWMGTLEETQRNEITRLTADFRRSEPGQNDKLPVTDTTNNQPR